MSKRDRLKAEAISCGKVRNPLAKLLLKDIGYFQAVLSMTKDEVFILADLLTFWHSVQTIRGDLKHDYDRDVSVRKIRQTLKDWHKDGLIRKTKRTPKIKEVWQSHDLREQTSGVKPGANEVFYVLTKKGRDKVIKAISGIMGGKFWDEPEGKLLVYKTKDGYDVQKVNIVKTEHFERKRR